MIGRENFNALLDGAHAMDQHFLKQKLENNIPVMLAWSDYFYNHTLKVKSRAVIPYSSRLKNLPTYLQQIEMESLGKHIQKNGERHQDENGMVVWGDIGPNAQHTFHQFLYQNTQTIPVEFIAIQESTDYPELKCIQLAQCLAQSKALWEGFRDEENPHKTIDPFNPSTIIFLEKITPYNIGALLAMYEHKVFILAELYHVNAFDQFGVELGKNYANALLPYFEKNNDDEKLDHISQKLLHLLK